MSTVLYTDEETGSEITESDDSYVVTNGEGETIAVVDSENAAAIASICEDLVDDTVEVRDRKGPEGNGWAFGQMSNILGIPTGFGFQRDDGELAVFRGQIELAEAFADVFGGDN